MAKINLNGVSEQAVNTALAIAKKKVTREDVLALAKRNQTHTATSANEASSIQASLYVSIMRLAQLDANAFKKTDKRDLIEDFAKAFCSSDATDTTLAQTASKMRGFSFLGAKPECDIAFIITQAANYKSQADAYVVAQRKKNISARYISYAEAFYATCKLIRDAMKIKGGENAYKNTSANAREMNDNIKTAINRPKAEPDVATLAKTAASFLSRAADERGGFKAELKALSEKLASLVKRMGEKKKK